MTGSYFLRKDLLVINLMRQNGSTVCFFLFRKKQFFSTFYYFFSFLLATVKLGINWAFPFRNVLIKQNDIFVAIK